MPGIFDLLTPLDVRDSYSITDPLYQRGGWREVDNLVDRDNVPLERRREGMFVYVLQTGKLYVLQGGVQNEHWTTYDTSQNLPSAISFQQLSLSPHLSVTSSGTLNNVSHEGYSVLRLEQPVTVTGFVGSQSTSGKLLVVQNVSSGQVTVKNDSNSSNVGNRLYTGCNNDVVLQSNSAYVFQYVHEKLHWYLTSNVGNNVLYSSSFNSVSQVTLNHNLGYYPQVLLYDVSGDEAVAQVVQPDKYTVVLQFNKNESGYVILK